MPTIRRDRLLRSILATISVLGLAGCDHFDVREAASHLPPYARPVDRPKTFIDTALDHCPDKTEEQETACVKTAVAARHLTAPALAGLLPACRLGHVCRYRYTTDDRLGYVPAMAADFIAHWQVNFDFTHPAKSAADVPLTVEER